MALYFLLHDAAAFRGQLAPALAASWHRRSFRPCVPLCQQLLPAAQSFSERFHIPFADLLVGQVVHGLPFDRHFWRGLVGELLFLAALDIPELPDLSEPLQGLLASPDSVQQVYFGSKDVVFGGYYRPGNAGYNDSADVNRLADFLAAIDPEAWKTGHLTFSMEDSEEERAEELEFLREGFVSLREFYCRARQRNGVVVCEIL
jgi:hypothetical protein